MIYDFTTAIVRTGTAHKLAKASALVKQQGYRLKVWDAYRPVSAQRRLFEVYPDPEFVAQPNLISATKKRRHLRFDLAHPDGSELTMPTAFDDFTAAAHRDAPRTTLQEKLSAAGHRHDRIRALSATLTNGGTTATPKWTLTNPSR